jgi:uncharacterized protein (DUF2267 family)
MALHFDKYAQDGKAFVNHLAGSLGYADDPAKAGRVLKAVLHALRDRISPEESLQLLAQLPMFLKAVYVEGWHRLSPLPRIKHLEDFIDEVVAADGKTGVWDFPTDAAAEHAIRTVFEALRKYVSEGEIEDIRAELPKALAELLY